MFEIDVYTRTTADRPFAVKTYTADTRKEALTILNEQSSILSQQYKHPKRISNGTLLQFKTNRGNVYAEIEINRVQS